MTRSSAIRPWWVVSVALRGVAPLILLTVLTPWENLLEPLGTNAWFAVVLLVYLAGSALIYVADRKRLFEIRQEHLPRFMRGSEAVTTGVQWVMGIAVVGLVGRVFGVF